MTELDDGGAVTLPIKPGTARRLGLRLPPSLPRMTVIAPSNLTDEQMEAFKTKWLEAWNAEMRALYGVPLRGKPYLMPAIERAFRPRRRWPWSRSSRSDTP